MKKRYLIFIVMIMALLAVPFALMPVSGSSWTIETTALLRERDWGDFTGHFIPDLAGLPFPQNTETMPQLMARATRFIDWVKSKYDGKTVLAVGHGIINKAILSVYSGAPMHEILKMTNAEYRVLKLE